MRSGFLPSAVKPSEREIVPRIFLNTGEGSCSVGSQQALTLIEWPSHAPMLAGEYTGGTCRTQSGNFALRFSIGGKGSGTSLDMCSTLIEIWLRGQDLNLRPSGYEPDIASYRNRCFVDKKFKVSSISLLYQALSMTPSVNGRKTAPLERI
jgi:hypothetical protein